MPTVPRVQRQIAPAALPAARLTAALTPAAAGVNVHEARADQALQEGQASARTWGAVSNLAETGFKHTLAWGQIIQQEKERADHVAVMEAENELLLRMNKMELAALSTQGKNAMGVPESTMGEFNEAANEIAGTLTTPRQKWAFNRVKGNRGAQLDMTVRRHTMRQMQTYEAEELQASITRNGEAAIAAYNDESTRDYNIANGITNIRQSGPRLGRSDEAIEGDVLKFTTATHVGVLRQYLAEENPAAAQAYFDQKVAQGEIHGSAQDEIRKQLHAGTERKRAQQEFDNILATEPDEEKWMARARAIKDDPTGAIRDDVESRIRTQRIINKEGERVEHDAQMRSATDQLDGGALWTDVMKRNPVMWQSFSPEERARLKTYSDNRIDKKDPEDDQAIYSQLMRLAYDPAARAQPGDPASKDQFLAQDMMVHINSLSKGSWRFFVELQNRRRAGDPDAAHALMVNPAQQNKMIDEGLLAMGFDPAPPQPGSKGYDPLTVEFVNNYRRTVRQEIAAITAGGKEATNEQVQVIIDELIKPSGEQVMTVDGWFSNTYRPLRKFEQLSSTLTIDQVPAKDIALIRAEQQRMGRAAPTNLEIIRAYQTNIRRQGAKK